MSAYSFLTEEERKTVFTHLLKEGVKTKPAFGAKGNYFPNPAGEIAKALQNCNLRESHARKKAVKTINALEEECAIECLRNGNGKIISIRIVWSIEPFPSLYEEYKDIQKASQIKAEAKEKEKNLPLTPEPDKKPKTPSLNSVELHRWQELKKIKRRRHPQGFIRELRKKNEKGDRSETKVEKVFIRVAEIIHQLPVEAHIEIKRAGKFNPRENKPITDEVRADLRKEDLNIFVRAPEKELPCRMIYQVKSSWAAAKKFNKNDRRLRSHQKDASLKRAITGNFFKPERKIAKEFLEDIIEKAGIHELKKYADFILSHF